MRLCIDYSGWTLEDHFDDDLPWLLAVAEDNGRSSSTRLAHDKVRPGYPMLRCGSQDSSAINLADTETLRGFGRKIWGCGFPEK